MKCWHLISLILSLKDSFYLSKESLSLQLGVTLNFSLAVVGPFVPGWHWCPRWPQHPQQTGRPSYFGPLPFTKADCPSFFFLRLSCHFTALTLHKRESLDFQWTGKKSVHGLQCKDLKWLEFCGRDSAEAERRLRLAPCKAGRGHCSSGGARRGADCRGGVGSERERGMERGEEGS